jgi:hypothetical protein
MEIKSCQKLLLLGAGFTYNFGGPLATEMWAWIFNSKFIQTQQKLRDLMIHDFDFESAYYEVMEGNYSEEEKEAMSDAVSSAYYRLDEIVREYNYNEFSVVNLYQVQNLIDRFSKTSGPSFIFTLNQDLFLERQYYNGTRLHLPGIQQNSVWFTPNFKQRIEKSQYIRLPSDEELEEIKELELRIKKFFYVKLHGSYAWIGSQGANLMVIGRGKEAKIQNEPLLKWYFDIFENVLYQPSRELLIIGYGFRDDHINEILSKAIRDYSLKIYIVSPVMPEEFRRNLRHISGAGATWAGLSGYFPFTLAQMYNRSGLTEAGRSLNEHFFEEPS